jgi:hypothetical protein
VFAVLVFQLAAPLGLAKLGEIAGLHPGFESVLATCGANGNGGDPPHDGRDISKCYACCMANVRAASVLSFIALYSVISFPISDALARPFFHRKEYREARPFPGRLNTCASRAPPSFS